MAMKRLRFSLGGSCAAASTISGMPAARQAAIAVGRSGRLVALARTPWRSPRATAAASISQASSPRTPARCRGRCGRCRSSVRRTPPAHGRSRCDGSAGSGCRREAVGMRQRRHLGHVPARDRRRAARVSAAAAPVVTSPASAPVASAMRALAASCSSPISTEAREAAPSRHDLGRHHRAAQPRQRTGGVDAAAHAQAGDTDHLPS